MIQNDDQLAQTRLAISDLESALRALKRDVHHVNPRRFALMAEPVIVQIQELRNQIEEYVGVKAAIAEEVSLWMRLAGDDIEPGDAPTSVVTKMLDTLRIGVQAVAEFLNRGMVGARPTAQINEACDLRIVAWEPGSIQVGLKLRDFDAAIAEDVIETAHVALRKYLEAATWAGSQSEPTDLERQIPDPRERRLLLSQVERIVPRPHGEIEYVELHGRDMPRGNVRLRRESRQRIRRAVEKTIRQIVQVELVTVEGILREIDLDQRTFIVRNAGQGNETRCYIAPEADDLLQLAKEALDHQVKVAGNRRTDSTRPQSLPLQAQEIEVLEKPVDENAVD
jgi:hypothetical protein